MKRILPEKLQPGDMIRIIAPAKSLATVSQEQRELVVKRFNDIGLVITYGKHVEEIDQLKSSKVQSRVSDLYDAFADKNVKGIICAAGGYNSNQLLPYLDWNLIQKNPKIFCGYSDITSLDAAIFSKTGLVTYAGPTFATFCEKLHFDYTLEYFIKCLMEDKPFEVKPSAKWSNNRWSENRPAHNNEGFWAIQEGEAIGIAIGENLITLDLLKGTEYFPDLEHSILFLEDDLEYSPQRIEENLQALILDEKFKKIRGIVFGRFQNQSKMNRELLEKIIATKPELKKIPIIANVDFGHTEPKFTFPFGGKAQIQVSKHNSSLYILEH